MPLICLEGPSAVGKTTTCKALVEEYSAYVVPEVNLLFERPTPEPEYWYFERQVERWAIAQAKLQIHELVIFDGDPLQPLWYNWCFEFVNWQHGSCFKPGNPSNALPPLSVLRDFYRQQIIERKLGFPDGYILLSSNETELKQRKENDSSRRRSGFAKNLLIIEPQKRYFQAINNLVPGFVHPIAATSIETNLKTIKALPAFPKLPEHPYSLTIFDLLIEWLSRNKPY